MTMNDGTSSGNVDDFMLEPGEKRHFVYKADTRDGTSIEINEHIKLFIKRLLFHKQ